MDYTNAPQHTTPTNIRPRRSGADRSTGDLSAGELRDRDQMIANLRTENAALHDLLNAQMAENDDLRLAFEILAAPVVERISGRKHGEPVDAHTLDCEGGFIDQTSLNI